MNRKYSARRVHLESATHSRVKNIWCVFDRPAFTPCLVSNMIVDPKGF